MTSSFRPATSIVLGISLGVLMFISGCPKTDKLAVTVHPASVAVHPINNSVVRTFESTVYSCSAGAVNCEKIGTLGGITPIDALSNNGKIWYLTSGQVHPCADDKGLGCGNIDIGFSDAVSFSVGENGQVIVVSGSQKLAICSESKCDVQAAP